MYIVHIIISLVGLWSVSLSQAGLSSHNAIISLSPCNNVPHCKENPIYALTEKKLRGLSPNFPFMYLWVTYILPRSVHLFSCSRPILGVYSKINRSQKHECRNWDCGLAISFLEIFISNFRYTIFQCSVFPYIWLASEVSLHNMTLTGRQAQCPVFAYSWLKLSVPL